MKDESSKITERAWKSCFAIEESDGRLRYCLARGRQKGIIVELFGYPDTLLDVHLGFVQNLKG